MCGILGQFQATGGSISPQDMNAAMGKIRHRGPDDQGYASFSIGDGSLTLAQNRLSIIDLSKSGHQPFSDADGRFTIVYNGEIYNYKELRAELCDLGFEFRTETDTEVLLAAWIIWGSDCLPRLTGMFAFALLDHETQILHCVRDAFGIKPFFFHLSSDTFIFGSEIPPLLELNPALARPNVQRAYDYLVLGRYDDTLETFFSDIQHLAPGHHMEISLSSGELSAQTTRWWFPDITECRETTFDQAVSQVRAKFLENVRLHLRSDVPLGAALSGGVDSSALVCAMRKLEPDMPIKTFSYVARGSSVDEEAWVDLVNEHVKAEAHKVIVDPSELRNDLEDLVRLHGEPFGSTSIYAGYRVFQQARQAGVTVTLDGQGADEIFAGYQGYPWALFHSLLEQWRLKKLWALMMAWADWPGRSRKQALIYLISILVPDRLQGMARRFVGKDPKPEWIDLDVFKEAGTRLSPYRRFQPDPRNRGRRLAELQRAVLTRSGMASLLRHGDRNSMRWSIESRVPFLTIGLAELALRLPERFQVSQTGETKHVFREAMRGIVPDEILDRKDKIGFETPERDWLRNANLDFDDLQKTAEAIPFLKGAATLEAVQKILDGREAFSWQAWRIINYCLWYKMYILQK